MGIEEADALGTFGGSASPSSEPGIRGESRQGDERRGIESGQFVPASVPNDES
jgi:hypothetical protein